MAFICSVLMSRYQKIDSRLVAAIYDYKRNKSPIRLDRRSNGCVSDHGDEA